jgi:hypothetical protein
LIDISSYSFLFWPRSLLTKTVTNRIVLVRIVQSRRICGIICSSCTKYWVLMLCLYVETSWVRMFGIDSCGKRCSLNSLRHLTYISILISVSFISIDILYFSLIDRHISRFFAVRILSICNHPVVDFIILQFSKTSNLICILVVQLIMSISNEFAQLLVSWNGLIGFIGSITS